MARKPTAKHEIAFQHWYADPERSVKGVADYVSVSTRTIARWMDAHEWRTRAATMDVEARRKADLATVKRQADMLQRHAVQGRNLNVTGANWFANHPDGVDNSRDAMSAIKLGQDLERRAELLPDWVVSILGMDDDELREQFNALANAAIGDHQGGGGTPGNTFTHIAGRDVDYRVAVAPLTEGSEPDSEPPGEGQNSVDGAEVG